MGVEKPPLLSRLPGDVELTIWKAQMTKFRGLVLCYFEMIQGEKLVVNCSVLSEAHLGLISFSVLLGGVASLKLSVPPSNGHLN